MKTPQKILTELTGRYTRHWRTWASEPSAGTWPLSLSLNPPRRTDLDADLTETAGHIRAWTSFEHDNPQAAVEWVTRKTKVGSQELPARLHVSSPQLVAALIGCQQHYETAVTRWTSLSAAWSGHPRLRTALAEAVRLSDDDFNRALDVAAWIASHPRSGLMPRQLPVEGIDTKWITSHSRLLTLLADADSGTPHLADQAAENIPDTSSPPPTSAGPVSGRADEAAQQAATLNALGLRPRPSYVRIALLDPADRAHFAGIRDLAISSEQLARLPVRPAHLIVIENLETALTLPDTGGAVVVHSLGHNLAPLRDLTWARQATQVTYWGDVDTEGFVILSAFRGLGYPARSILMDEATLVRYRHFAVEDAAIPDRGDLPNLTQTEYDTWQGLLSDRWGRRLRLEQERIPLRAGVQALQAAADISAVHP